MSKPVQEIRRGPGRPPTTGRGHTIGMRLHKPALKALDGYRAVLGPDVTRAGAAKMIVERTLESVRRGGKD